MIYDLIEIYPDSVLNPEEKVLRKIDNYYLIKEGSDHLYILLEKLGEKEIDLLKLITNERAFKTAQSTSLEDLLVNGIVDDSIKIDRAQLVYLHVSHLEESNFQLWKNTLKDSIKEIEEVNSITDHLMVILLDARETKKEVLIKLKEVIQSLDQDFNLLTQGMLGQVTHLTPQIKDVFAYEREVFQSFIKKQRIDGIILLSDVLINQIALILKKETIELPMLLNYLSNKSEVKDLIECLFKNQGNLSQTADELFIHRNTLSYRIKQFYDKTAFNLNYFPDLILCYLLTI